MTVVQQIVFTAQTERWCSLAEALGFSAVGPLTSEWSEFAGGGLLAIHHLSDREPGEIDLCLLVDDLDAAEASVSTLDGVSTRHQLLEGVGEMVVITASSGVSVAVFAGGTLTSEDASIRVQPIWFQEQLDEPRAILEALGLTVELTADSGRWVELHGTAGSVGLHHGEAPGLSLSFQADQLDPLAARLVEAGFDAAIIDEAYGRSLRIRHDEGEVWVNERQDDLYGYRRE